MQIFPERSRPASGDRRSVRRVHSSIVHREHPQRCHHQQIHNRGGRTTKKNQARQSACFVLELYGNFPDSMWGGGGESCTARINHEAHYPQRASPPITCITPTKKMKCHHHCYIHSTQPIVMYRPVRRHRRSPPQSIARKHSVIPRKQTNNKVDGRRHNGWIHINTTSTRRKAVKTHQNNVTGGGERIN